MTLLAAKQPVSIRPRTLALVVLLMIGTRAALPAQEIVVVRTIALSGDPAPGTPFSFGGAQAFESPPAINNEGRVVVVAKLSQPPGTTFVSSGIWIGDPQGLSLVAQSGTPTPDGDEFDFFTNVDAVINDQNQIAFYSTQRIWRAEIGKIEKVIESGQTAATTGGTIGPLNDPPQFGFHRQPRLTDSGEIGVRVPLNGVDTDFNLGFFRATPGLLELVAQKGMAFPGGLPDLVPSGLGTLRVSGTGTLFASFGIDGPGVGPGNDELVWRGSSGDGLVIAREGSSVPGAPAGTVYGRPADFVACTNGGTVGFQTQIIPGGAALMFGDASDVSVLVRRDDPAPGVPGGATFGSSGAGVFGNPALNSQGELVFAADVTGPMVGQSSGLWRGCPGDLQLVTYRGAAAPGTGSTFGSFLAWTSNDLGQIAFRADVEPGPGEPTAQGVWLTSPSGALLPVAVVFEALAVAPGDERLVSDVRIHDGAAEDGRPRTFNNSGQLAFRASFLDGTEGVFLATVEIAFRRGDCNGDGIVDPLIDSLFLLTYGFAGGPPPPCVDAADVDDDGVGNSLLDALYLLGFGFLGGDPPPPPHDGCGGDPTKDDLECTSHPGCL